MIASRSPMRRLAIEVARPTITSAIAPASANWPTWIATTRRSARRLRGFLPSSTAASTLGHRRSRVSARRGQERPAVATAPDLRVRSGSDRRSADAGLAGLGFFAVATMWSMPALFGMRRATVNDPLGAFVVRTPENTRTPLSVITTFHFCPTRFESTSNSVSLTPAVGAELQLPVRSCAAGTRLRTFVPFA